MPNVVGTTGASATCWDSYIKLLKKRKSGAPSRTRTGDLRLRRPSLYPAELRAPLGLRRLGPYHSAAPR